MTSWTTGVCHAGGVDMHYLRTGGPKPPVVLLHGLTASGGCWTPLARALEHDYDVVMPDARGHGASGSPPDGYGYDDHASDVIALIRELGLSAPVLLGHSMGGMTAAVVASRAPGMIRAVILADPTFLTAERQREVFGSDVAAQHRRLLGQPSGEVLADLRSRHPHRTSEILKLIASARLQTRMKAFDVLEPPNPDYRELVRAIDVPILLVISDGGVVSRETASELQRLNPRVRIELIHGAGHAMQFDQPERFEAVVRAFLDSVAASSEPPGSDSVTNSLTNERTHE